MEIKYQKYNISFYNGLVLYLISQFFFMIFIFMQSGFLNWNEESLIFSVIILFLISFFVGYDLFGIVGTGFEFGWGN